jgi:hypothetical protein
LRRQWARLLGHRAAALAQADRGPEAVKAVQQALDLTAGLLRGDREWRCPPATAASVWSFLAVELYWQEPCYLYDLACTLALASTLPGEAGLPDPAGRALRALHDYAASGFDNPHALRTDPALEPLRNRPDFQDLVRELEVTASGRNGPR